jgi:predicted nucleic acid-binding protein
MFVVDTSVLISYLRGENSKASRYFDTIERNKIPYAIPNICFQEVLQGAKDESSWKILNDYLSTQHVISAKHPVTTYREAARIYYNCRKKGLTVRSSNDCLIAQIVIEHDGVLVHNDKDFTAIAKVCELRFPEKI